MRSEVLQRILERGQASDSDILYITQGEEVLLDWQAPEAPPLIEIMSIGKSIVALAIGKLVDEGKIESIDKPLYHRYPEWYQGQKERITLRMILNHTSGLQTVPGGDEISRSPDCVKLALCAELSSVPGDTFFYNNKAVNILSDVIYQSSGQKVDAYVQDHFFTPLGIQEKVWKQDKNGTPYSLGGVQMKPKDVHKIGRLVLNKGRWEDKQLISEAWLKEMLTPSQVSNNKCGLLWWVYENPKIYAAQGYLGQWLYIVPEKNIIALRQLKSGKKPLDQVDEFKDFQKLVAQL